MENAHISQTQASPPKTRWTDFLSAFPILQFIGLGIITLAATWTTIQLTQNSQAAEIRRQGEKLERLEKDSVNRELFDERTLKIIEEQKRQGERLEKLLDRK